MRVLMRQVLERRGYHVLEAANGVEGLSVDSRHAGTIDLVVTDVVMPRMGGTELAELLKQQRPSVRVLYVSGYAESGPARDSILRKGMPLLKKPFTPQELASKIRQLLDTPTATYQVTVDTVPEPVADISPGFGVHWLKLSRDLGSRASHIAQMEDVTWPIPSFSSPRCVRN